MNTTKDESIFLKKYKILFYLIGIYVVALAASDTFTYQVVYLFNIKVSGSALIFPLVYTINDIITELYGFPIARQTIWVGLVAEGFFDIICGLVARLPASSVVLKHDLYIQLLGPLPKIYISALIAVGASLFTNSFLMSKSKQFLHGKLFWLRSIFSTLSGELVFLLIFYSMSFIGKTSLLNIIELIGTSFVTKIIFAAIIAFPAALVVKLLKRRRLALES